ncbi:MAG: MMPL family transporter, partial [Chloroflexota bacterium]|nr:MMPL family transporter [Chloroflexota bacterium]
MSLFQRLGAFCARRRYAVVAAWAVLLLLALPFAPQLPGALSGGGFTLDDLEASKARQALAGIAVPPSAMVIVIQSETDARAGDPAFEIAAARALAAVPQAVHVTAVLPHTLAPRQISADRKTVYEVVALDLSPDDSPDALAPVEAAIAPQPGLRIMLAGGPAFYGDIQVLSENDLRRSEII